MIDKTAIIDPKAKLSTNVNISVNAKIGKGNNIYPFVSINNPQDLKYNGESTALVIGDNNKIGNNCIIAGQVGFAGSSSLGNNVMIGGQAGVSGHLKIGNNVKIGGGSGVVKDIEDNQIVMGYPAVDFRQFLKNQKK